MTKRTLVCILCVLAASAVFALLTGCGDSSGQLTLENITVEFPSGTTVVVPPPAPILCLHKGQKCEHSKM